MAAVVVMVRALEHILVEVAVALAGRGFLEVAQNKVAILQTHILVVQQTAVLLLMWVAGVVVLQLRPLPALEMRNGEAVVAVVERPDQVPLVQVEALFLVAGVVEPVETFHPPMQYLLQLQGVIAVHTSVAAAVQLTQQVLQKIQGQVLVVVAVRPLQAAMRLLAVLADSLRAVEVVAVLQPIQ